MSYGESVSHDHDHHDHKPGFIKRWFFSTNHKDIGTLYIIFALVAGLIGGFFSLVMRAELAAPGLDIVADGQAWNVIITAHSLGSYIGEQIANDKGVEAELFNIGSSPLRQNKIRINPKITHYTTNKGSVIDPVSMTSARLDFYNRVQVDAKEDVGSGILKYHTIEHFTEQEKKQKQKDKISS